MMDSDSSDENSVIWSKGDCCMVLWSGDNSFYRAKILGFKKEDNYQNKKALVRFDGFSKDADEYVELNSLRKLRNTKRKQKLGNNTDNAGVISIDLDGDCVHLLDDSRIKISTAEEERKRLLDKFSILEKEERDEFKANPSLFQNDSQKCVSRTSARKRRSSRSAAKSIVAVGGEEKRKCNTQNKSSSESSDREESTSNTTSTSSNSTTTMVNTGERTLASKKRIPTGLTSSESEAEDDTAAVGAVTNKSSCSPVSGGFSDLDMERPFFPNVTPRSGKQPLLLSKPGDKPVVQVPATINRYLRDYQREGISFLYKHYMKNEGAVLADDMGLGKTVQVIAFIAAIMRKTGTKKDVVKNIPKFIRKLSENASLYGTEDEESRKPFLIIGPATVMHNWVDELETWGHFSVGKFHKNSKSFTVADLEKSKLDVVVTTYETCRDHLDTLNDFTWNAVIADEAHKIKVRQAEITKALKKLNCKRRYALTGTPLQNRLQEFWCIFDWANPGCLGDLLTFKNSVCKVIEKGQAQEATKRELADARKAQERLAKAKAKWMIRRTKKLIADQLPKKEELVVYSKCTELQSDIYKTIMSQPDMTYILQQREPCTCGRDAARGRCCYQKTPSGKSVKALTFTYMHLLMKAANHIALLLPINIEADNQRQYARSICEEVFEKHPQFLAQTQESAFRTLSDPKYCGKMKLLTGLLSVFKKKNNKVLLFSYSTRLLDIIEQYVMSKGYEYRRLDGNTPDGKRMQLIKDFNKDPAIFLFLISTRAGGVGLNLTGANVVIIFDPNWNPTHDLQAQDRAYRLGQNRDVKIYRLISSGTIEENIYLRQILKQQQATIAVEGENAKRYFNDGELLGICNMFLMRESDRCLTEDILKRNRKVEEGLKAFRIEHYIPGPKKPTDSDDDSEGVDCSESGDSEEEYLSSGANSSGDPEYDEGEKDCNINTYNSNTSRYKTPQRSTQILSESKSRSNRTPFVSKIRDINETTKKELDTFFESLECDENRTPAKYHKAIEKKQKRTSADLLEQGKVSSQVASSSKSRLQTSPFGSKICNVDESVKDELDEFLDSLECDEMSVDQTPVKSGGEKKHNAKLNTKNASQVKTKKQSVKKLKNSLGSGDNNKGSRSSRRQKKMVQYENDSMDSQGTVDYNSSSEEEQIQPCTKKPVRRKPPLESSSPDVKRKKGVGKKSQVKSMKSTGGRPHHTTVQETFESVSDVLDVCGVVHMHNNHKIIGPSRAEDHMSRCAIQDVYVNNMCSQVPAMDCQPYSASSEESDDLGEVHRKKRMQKQKDSAKLKEEETKEESVPSQKPKKRGRQKSSDVHLDQPWSQVIGSKTVLVGQTPKEIRLRHFTALAAYLDLEPNELAKRFMYSHPQERQGVLKSFYTSQDQTLEPVMRRIEEASYDEQSTKGGQQKPKKTTDKCKRTPLKKSKRRTQETYSERVMKGKTKSNKSPTKGVNYSESASKELSESISSMESANFSTEQTARDSTIHSDAVDRNGKNRKFVKNPQTINSNVDYPREKERTTKRTKISHIDKTESVSSVSSSNTSNLGMLLLQPTLDCDMNSSNDETQPSFPEVPKMGVPSDESLPIPGVMASVDSDNNSSINKKGVVKTLTPQDKLRALTQDREEEPKDVNKFLDDIFF